MTQLNGKWRLVSSDNSDAFFEAVKPSEEFKKMLSLVDAEIKAKNPDAYIEEFHVDIAANTVHRNVYIKGEKKKDSGDIPLGAELEGRCHGKPAKKTVTMVSDCKIVRQEKGADFSSTSTVEVNGSEMTLTLQSGSVTATEKYERIE